MMLEIKAARCPGLGTYYDMKSLNDPDMGHHQCDICNKMRYGVEVVPLEQSK